MEDTAIQYRHDLLNDKWISEIVFPGLTGGFCVEAGATSGMNGSGTYILEKEYQWSGICIEPIPYLCSQIPQHRNANYYNACLYNVTGEEVEFTHYPDRNGHSSISHLNINVEKLRGEKCETLHIRTITLLDVLKKFNAPSTVHYLCLDTEGSEEVILSAFFETNSEYRILAASIEGHRCDDLMEANGYVPVTNPFTDKTFEAYFVHNSIADQVPLANR